MTADPGVNVTKTHTTRMDSMVDEAETDLAASDSTSARVRTPLSHHVHDAMARSNAHEMETTCSTSDQETERGRGAGGDIANRSKPTPVRGWLSSVDWSDRLRSDPARGSYRPSQRP